MISLLAFVLILIIIILIIDGACNHWEYDLNGICFDAFMGFVLGVCAWFLICVIFSPDPNIKTEENSIITNEIRYELVEKNYKDREFYLIQKLDGANDLSYSYDYLNEKGKMFYNEVGAIDARIHYIAEDEDPYVIKKEYDSASKAKRNFFVNVMSDTYDFYIPENTVLTYDETFTD